MMRMRNDAIGKAGSLVLRRSVCAGFRLSQENGAPLRGSQGRLWGRYSRSMAVARMAAWGRHSKSAEDSPSPNAKTPPGTQPSGDLGSLEAPCRAGRSNASTSPIRRSERSKRQGAAVSRRASNTPNAVAGKACWAAAVKDGLLQLHRRLVQPGAAAFRPRLPLAHGLRTCDGGPTNGSVINQARQHSTKTGQLQMSQSNRWRIAASRCLTLGAASSRIIYHC
jgi:hypothetical protein